MEFDPQHTKNAAVKKYLGNAALSIPTQVGDPYLDLGTHPDLVQRLWEQLTVNLPVDCRGVAGKRPVLVRPDNGVVFGIAVGTKFYALRLPTSDREVLDLARHELVNQWADERGIRAEDRERYVAKQTEDCPVGHEWINGKWLSLEIELAVKAYDFAA